MTISDKWLIDRAVKLKASKAAPLKQSGARMVNLPPIDHLWDQLQRETRRQAAVFTGALGDPNALVVDTSPDAIEVRTPDGRQLTLRVDRERRSLSETFRDAGGGVRRRRPIIAFTADAAGGVAFNFGGLQGAAGSLLRRLIG